MIKSMTAFARKSEQADWGQACWEIRSVNHRYLEMAVRLPEALRELEMAVRDLARQKLARGKVECTLRFERQAVQEATLRLDQPMLSALHRLQAEAAAQVGVSEVASVMEYLRWPGVVTTLVPDVSEVADKLLLLFDQALDELSATRAREGKTLAEFITQRLDQMEAIIASIEPLLPAYLAQARQRLQNRFAELKVELDSTRLEQEMLLLTNKMDVAEEVARLRTHIKEVRRTLSSKDAIGRRLDFLMQELNREANTLAAKSNSPELTQATVDLKVFVEQMREQVQNIE